MTSTNSKINFSYMALRPDRLVPNAKVSIPGRGSGVRLSANLINTPEGHGSTVTVRSRVRPAILTGGISMLSSLFRSDLRCISIPSTTKTPAQVAQENHLLVVAFPVSTPTN